MKHTNQPRVIGDLSILDEVDADARGAVWKLTDETRDLDSNLIRLPADEQIGDFTGPEIDSLIVVVSGSGTLRTEGGPISLRPGQLVWLPRRSLRGYQAGAQGLAYLTVHQRRVVEPLMPTVREGD